MEPVRLKDLENSNVQFNWSVYYVFRSSIFVALLAARAADTVIQWCWLTKQSACLNRFDWRWVDRNKHELYLCGLKTFETDLTSFLCNHLIVLQQVGGVNANQTAVYEEFARSIPGFQPPQAGESITTPPLPKPVGILGNAEVSISLLGTYA